MGQDVCSICKNKSLKIIRYYLNPTGWLISDLIKICDSCEWSLNEKYGTDENDLSEYSRAIGHGKWFRDGTSTENYNYSDVWLKGVINKNVKDDFKDLDKLRKEVEEITKQREEITKQREEKEKKEDEERLKRIEREAKKILKIEDERIEALKKLIVQLLKDKPIKMPTSDIDAHLKHRNLDEIKTLCEELYNDGKISFAGNGRYFILTEEQEKPKKTSAPKAEKVDVKAALKKYKGMLDDGLIEQEDYDAKKKELLG